MKSHITKIIICLLLIGCIGCTPKQEEISEIYPEIINECVMINAEQDDILAMLKNGTGVIFFSWKNCPWCHSYINYVNESARVNDLQVLYYDMYDDRDDNTSFYKQVCELISDSIDEYAYVTNNQIKKAYDSNGKVRLYMPLVIYTDRGNIVGMDYSGSMEEDYEINGDNFWNEIIDGNNKRKDILALKLNDWSQAISQIKKQIDEQGCDNACEIKEN
ncbi:MAG: hypothetical protein Q4E33_04660 [Erysipelotrichaceae bacterium]|nr:hypothetical protein [Erysipelotrichaceae bacterium]